MLKKLVVAALALLAVGETAFAGDYVLGNRSGGYVKLHMDVARQWLREGRSVVIDGLQESAAGVQVIVFARNGGKICATPRALIWLHKSSTGRRVAEDGYHDPEEFNIPPCAGTYRSKRVKIMTWGG